MPTTRITRTMRRRLKRMIPEACYIPNEVAWFLSVSVRQVYRMVRDKQYRRKKLREIVAMMKQD